MSGPVLIAPVRGRLQAHFRRLSARWSTLAADSFSRVDSAGLGTTDSGHAWHEVTAPALAPAWQIQMGSGRVVVDLALAHQQVAYVDTASSDVRVVLKLVAGGFANDPGPGIFFRGAVDGKSGWLLAADNWAGSSWSWFKWNGAVAGGAVQAFTVPAITLGDTVTVEVRALGNVMKAYINGALSDTLTDGTYQANTRHGVYMWQSGYAAIFKSFRCTRWLG